MMRRPRRMPRPANPLDRIIQRWQHRWETNPQFRAAWSGVAGLVIVLSLCACLGTVSTLVSRTVAGFTGANTNSNQVATQGQGSGGQIGAAQSFPTFTSPPLPPPSIPAAGKIPNSQTPLPSPSAQPTATAAPTATSGGPGGPPGGTCSGGSGTLSWALNPCPQIHGQSGSLVITDRAHPGHTLNVVLNLGSCGSCTKLYPPGTYSLDGSGALTISYQVPSDANTGTPISGMIQISGGPSTGFSGPPVQ
jgi:hypothetical protein